MTAELLDDTSRPTLRNSRDTLSAGHCDSDITQAVTRILANANRDRSDAAGALGDLQTVLEGIRETPAGIDRIARMNAFVRTLGRADHLAIFLETMRRSLSSDDPTEKAVAEKSRSARMHCIYGWGGDTLMLASHTDPTPATTPPEEGVTEFFAYPVPEWHLNIHIWQPHPGAQGFESTKRHEPGVIVEPPHSHPFSFVSYVAIGGMRQSIYEEDSLESPRADVGNRYHDVELERVDGVWPPHNEHQRSRLRTVEDRLHLKAGHSYYMPADLIHDVEVERETAANTPAITLFLSTETMRIPRAYMVSAMADFHRRHPDVKDSVSPLDPDQWDAKLAATARYLRGDTDHLRLHEVVKCNSTYGFMNV